MVYAHIRQDKADTIWRFCEYLTGQAIFSPLTKGEKGLFTEWQGSCLENDRSDTAAILSWKNGRLPAWVK